MSKLKDAVRPKDGVLYCERCGISFLWTIEEQHQAAASGSSARAATHCPGCRHLLPTADRERGLVKWYNQRKRYGFIARAEGNDLFAHGSEVQERKRLHPGDLVEFSVGHTDRGPAAQEIQLLQRISDHQTTA